MKHFLLLLFVGLAVVSCRRNLGTIAAPNSIAVVAGEPVPMEAKDDLGGFILSRLLESYAVENGLFATDSEIESCLARLTLMRQDELAELEGIRISRKGFLSLDNLNLRQRTETEEQLFAVEELIAKSKARSSLSPEKQMAADNADREQAERSIRDWKVNRSLFEKYGGNVTSQPNGPAPFDAYREFLKEQKALGRFKLHDENLDQEFWKTFEDDKGNEFLNPEAALALPVLKHNGLESR